MSYVNGFYVKICGNIIQVHNDWCNYNLGTFFICPLPEKYTNTIEKNFQDIKLGIARGGIDTKNQDVVKNMKKLNEHLALSHFFLNKIGLFRPRIDNHIKTDIWLETTKQKLINEYEEEQLILGELLNEGFKILSVNNEKDSLYNYVMNHIKNDMRKNMDLD